MKKLFIILFLTLFFALNTQAKEINFIQVTDLNLNSNNASKVYALIKEINQRKNVDFVVFTGNNLKSANCENLKTFSYLLKKIHKKTYVLLGNQDVASSNGVDKEFYYKNIRKSLGLYHSDKPNFVFKKKGYVFIAMDGSKQFFQSANGYYTKKELMWLSDNLEKYKNKKVIILQHFPLVATNLEWKNTHNVEEYRAIIDKYTNIKAIISGHYGSNIEKKENNVSHIITQSFSKNYAYKLIKIDLDDDFIYTYLVK